MVDNVLFNRVHRNLVAIFEEGNRTTDSRFWSDVADDESSRGSGEAAVGEKADFATETGTNDGTRLEPRSVSFQR